MATPAPKTNLDPLEQVAYLRDKRGVHFELVDEGRAADYLVHENFLFRVKAFSKLFDTYQSGTHTGEYVGLDFGHLIELYELDGALRSLMLSTTLSVEHAIRTRINSAAMRAGADSYELSADLLTMLRNSIESEQINRYDAAIANSAIDETLRLLSTCDDSPKGRVAVANDVVRTLSAITFGRNPDHVKESFAAMHASPYSRGLVTRYTADDMPYWVLLSLVSFGPLIKIYRYCFRSGGPFADDAEAETYSEVARILRRAQVMRNSAAHSDLLLHSLTSHERGSSVSAVRKALRRYELDPEIVAPVAHMYTALDTAASLICFDVIVSGEDNRRREASLIDETKSRFSKRIDWFEKNYAISVFLAFCDALFCVASNALTASA